LYSSALFLRRSLSSIVSMVVIIRVSFLVDPSASDYVAEELKANGFAAPADVEERESGIIYENHETQQQDPSEFEAPIDKETHIEYPTPSFPSSADLQQDASLALPRPPSTPIPEEPVGEPPKLTYASVVSKHSVFLIMPNS
jgi:hypothetical protein